MGHLLKCSWGIPRQKCAWRMPLIQSRTCRLFTMKSWWTMEPYSEGGVCLIHWLKLLVWRAHTCLRTHSPTQLFQLMKAPRAAIPEPCCLETACEQNSEQTLGTVVKLSPSEWMPRTLHRWSPFTSKKCFTWRISSHRRIWYRMLWYVNKLAAWGSCKIWCRVFSWEWCCKKMHLRLNPRSFHF